MNLEKMFITKELDTSNTNPLNELKARRWTAFASLNEGRRDGAFLGLEQMDQREGQDVATSRRVFVSCHWGRTGHYKDRKKFDPRSVSSTFSVLKRSKIICKKI